MDLLDSILNGMEKPPTIRKPEIKDKEQREKFEKLQKERLAAEQKQKEAIEKFRSEFSKRITLFISTPKTDEEKTYRWQLKPMNKIFRSIIHEICEEHEEEVVAHSFGQEDIDRHCIVWKKGFEPSEEELRCMKLGVEYKPKTKDQDDDEKKDDKNNCNEYYDQDGKDKFRAKYEKIIGENASGIESAKIAMPAKQYGCVPIENKRDLRSIEQMMNDIRKNKKQKLGSSDRKDDQKQEETEKSV